MAEQDIEIDLESGEELDQKQHAEETEETEERVEQDHSSTEDSSEEHADDDSEEHSEDATDDEREAIRERRREERKQRKLAQREREDNLRRELAARDAVINELRTKVDGIERRNNGSELAKLEQAKQQTVQAYNYYKEQIRVATEAGNGALVADATEKLMQTQRRFDEIQAFERAQKQRQSAPQPLDPRLVNNAQSWMQQNKWYDPSAKDVDSRVVMTLDQQLAEEGWDPTTEEYW